MRYNEPEKKCHNCQGKGTVEGGSYKGKCLYCKGKGFRFSFRGPDQN